MSDRKESYNGLHREYPLPKPAEALAQQPAKSSINDIGISDVKRGIFGLKRYF